MNLFKLFKKKKSGYLLKFTKSYIALYQIHQKKKTRIEKRIPNAFLIFPENAF